MFTSINPATGEAGDSFAELTSDEIETKVARAEEAFRSWRTTDYATRTDLLEKIAEQFEANKRRLGEIATREMGKTLKSAIAEKSKNAPAAFRHYAQNGPAICSSRSNQFTVATGAATARWLPMGPVLAVMPWNFPYWQVVRFAGADNHGGQCRACSNTRLACRAARRPSRRW